MRLQRAARADENRGFPLPESQAKACDKASRPQSVEEQANTVRGARTCSGASGVRDREPAVTCHSATYSSGYRGPLLYAYSSPLLTPANLNAVIAHPKRTGTAPPVVSDDMISSYDEFA